MRVAGSIFLWLLALQVQGIHISNSTRKTTGALWTMANIPDDPDYPDPDPDSDYLNYLIFDELQSYALWCCRTIYGGIPDPDNPNAKPIQDCAKLQIGYYVYIPKRYYDFWPVDELLLWLDENFNPGRQDPTTAIQMCAGAPSTTQRFPNFAAAPRGTGGEDHTEATLVQPMTYIASLQKQKETPTYFFLFSRNSPCCTNDNGNCQQKIFKFTYENLYAQNNAPFHNLVVGFPQWYMYPSGATISSVRTSFCGKVQQYKKKYNDKDFFNVLSFQKTNVQTGNGITDTV